jgi:hypothetical protein
MLTLPCMLRAELVPHWTVRHLCIMYPEAVLKRNFQLARSNIHMCSDDVAHYLWVQVNNMASC